MLRNLSATSTSVILVSVLATGCATTGAAPDDMSATRHREEAKRHKKRADGHRHQYRPEATRSRVLGGRGDAALDTGLEYEEYNPTDWHLAQSRRHRQHSEDHRRAADALDSFEAKQCQAFEPTVRRACPLLGPIKSVVPIDDGVRFHLRAGVDAEKLMAHLECHFAFGRAQGREGMTTCPLYLRDLRVNKGSGDTVDLTTPHPDDLPELRRRALDHVPR